MERTTVLVAGGGPVGLSMATLLGRFGVPTVMVERRPGAAKHPRARSMNLRTTEIFRSWGIIDELEAVSLPEPWTRQMVYTETLAGRELGRVASSTQGVVDGVALSPAPWLLSSQDQFEPVIRRYAETLPAADLRWETQLAAFDADPAGVTATLVDLRSGAERQLRADWLVAADGAGSRIRRRLEIGMEGRHGLATLVNCHFYADLGRFTDDRPAMLYWTTAPARNVFQKIDMADRWLCQIGYDPREHRAEDFDPETSAAWIRRSVGEDVAVDVIDVIPWEMSSTVAERLRSGRVLLVGDAAHQLPPSGGFGMNTGVQDAHNLAWKLAYLHRGWSDEALLDSYEPERRPVAAYNAARSLENTYTVGRIRKLAEGRAQGDIDEALAQATRYGNWLGMDLGLHYDAGAVMPDGTPPPEVEDPVSTYAPSARPGHRAPHLELRRGTATISTLDLFDERFVLLAGSEGQAWCDAAAELDRPWLVAHRVAADGELAPVQGTSFEAAYGLEPGGAVVVRPDGHVAWRSPGPVTESEATLRQMLDAFGLR